MPNAASESLLKRSLFPFVSLIVSLILAPNSKHLAATNTWPATNTWSRQHQPSFRGYSRYQTPLLAPRTPDPATAFPNLILVQNEPPLVALSMPNAASESLQKRSLFPFVSLIVSLILAPNTWPATNTWSRQHQPSFRGYSRYQTPLLAPRTPDPAPLVALSVPNAASECLQKRSLFPFVSLIVSLILAPNTRPATNTWSRQHQPSFRGYSRYQTPLLAPRTPDPATAFPNLILVQNEPPLVALSMPNAASESLQKRSLFPFVSLIVSLILASNTWPATNTWSRQHQPSSRSYSGYQTPLLDPRTPDPATAFVLSLPNAASSSPNT